MKVTAELVVCYSNHGAVGAWVLAHLAEKEGVFVPSPMYSWSFGIDA